MQEKSVKHIKIKKVSIHGIVETEDQLAVEEPLEIQLKFGPKDNQTKKSISVTMRTPGNDEELAAGFLFTEGIITNISQVEEVKPDAFEENKIIVELSGNTLPKLQTSERNFYTTSSCGVCGKASIEAVSTRGLTRPRGDALIDPERLCALPDRLRPAQALFGKTGGLHAAALFDPDDRLVSVREDVGRHNAVDKIVGRAVMERRVPLSNHLLLVSGRGGFEIVQKALVAGVPVLASVSAPSSLAVRLAREYDLTLIGFLRGRRFVVYAGERRIIRDNPGMYSREIVACRR